MVDSYTELKGFTSLSESDLQTAIETNLISFLDWGLLNKGGFTNVSLTSSNINSSNKSSLRKVTDTNFSGSVWSTFHQNLVWESGLSTQNQPIDISGVYVNGSFKTPTSSGYQHYIDYTNGNVVFSSAISATTVKMEYSYKNVLVTKIDAVPILKEMQFRSFDISVNGYNTPSSGDWSILNRAKVQPPLIAIELAPSVSFTPLELGNTCQVAHTDVLFHVLADNDETVKKLSWIISMQKDKTVFLYDIDAVAQSGYYGLDYRGAKSNNPKTYDYLVENLKFNKLTFSDMNIQNVKKIGSLYHGVVRGKTEVVTTL